MWFGWSLILVFLAIYLIMIHWHTNQRIYFKEGLFIFASTFIGSSHCDRLQRFYAAYAVAVAAKDSSVPARCWVKHEQLFVLVDVGIVTGVVFVLNISNKLFIRWAKGSGFWCPSILGKHFLPRFMYRLYRTCTGNWHIQREMEK